MTTPEALRAAPRSRLLPAGIERALDSQRDGPWPPSRDLDAPFDAAPFDPGALALWDEGLRRLEVRS